jgi:hypothetical protein
MVHVALLIMTLPLVISYQMMPCAGAISEDKLSDMEGLPWISPPL